MKIKLRLTGLFGLAAFAALVVMAAGASAAFGFSEFKAAGGGNPAGITFTGTGGIAKFESVKKNVVTCEKSKSTGTIVSSTEAKVTVTYEGKCEVKGAATGTCETVKTSELKISPSTTKVGSLRGMLIMPVTGTTMAVVKCAALGAETITVSGGVICENPKPTPASTTGEVVCTQVSAGEQTIKEDEVGGSLLKCELTANTIFTNEKDAQITKEVVTYSASVEQT